VSVEVGRGERAQQKYQGPALSWLPRYTEGLDPGES